MVTLGVIYVIVTLAILGLSALFDDGVLFRMLVLGDIPENDALKGPVCSSRPSSLLSC